MGITVSTIQCIILALIVNSTQEINFSSKVCKTRTEFCRNCFVSRPTLHHCTTLSSKLISRRQGERSSLDDSLSDAVKTLGTYYNIGSRTGKTEPTSSTPTTDISTVLPTRSTIAKIDYSSTLTLSTEATEKIKTDISENVNTDVSSTEVIINVKSTSSVDATVNIDKITTANTQECFDYLGMISGDIPDANIEASDTYGRYETFGARIHGSSKWASKQATPWIQADIGYRTFVSGLITQGSAGIGLDGWITSFKVSTFYNSIDDNEILVKDDNGNVLEFSANVDTSSLVTSRFPTPVDARIVRITCLTKSNISYNCMRFELLGCKIS